MKRYVFRVLVGALALSGCVAAQGEQGEDEVGASDEALRTRGSHRLCTTFDLPDDSFLDTNCDGIDGNVSSAVFVSASGDDADAGTMDAPMLTLRAAIARAEETRKSEVYVQNGVYTISQALDIADGISIYGGYANDWSRNNSRPILWRPWEPGWEPSAIVAREIVAHTVIDRLILVTGDAEYGGNTGLAVSHSPGLSLSRVYVRVGDGGGGAHGDDGADGRDGVRGVNGGPGGSLSPRGGAPLNYGCNASGRGGSTGPGSPGASDDFTVPAARGGNGGARHADGRRGQDGFSPTSTNRVAPHHGAGGEPGQAGADGARGRNGGGGGGGGVGGRGWWPSPLRGGGGGSGGTGGCGGEAGTGGEAGGGSTALLVHGSLDGRVTRSEFHAGDGGRGGDGGIGGQGGERARGGLGGAKGDLLEGRGGEGGSGGRGEIGGSGGAGGGGNSFAVLAYGSDLTEADLVAARNHMTFGHGGAGGQAREFEGEVGPDLSDPGSDGREAKVELR